MQIVPNQSCPDCSVIGIHYPDRKAVFRMRVPDDRVARETDIATVCLRVLIVDDEAMIAEFLTDVIEGLGHEVCAVADTEDEAVIAAELTKPDLMIIDATLRAGSGPAAVARIVRDRHVPHIFMSGDRRALASLHPAVTIGKPFSERDLARAIGRATRTAHTEAS